MERNKQRRNFIIPLLLIDEDTQLTFKAVVLDVSSKGLKAFSNDKRLLLVNEDILKEKTFKLEFDFFDVPTQNLNAKVVNISPGEHPQFERRLGMSFVDIRPELVRTIEEFLQEHHN